MRTTLTLDDDVIAAARKRARLLKVSLGRAVSDLARRGAQSTVPVKEENGLLVFAPPPGGPKITAEKVKELLNDFP